MSTGRFIVTDPKTGRRFMVEPMATRGQRVNDKTWEVGGAQDVNGGAIREEDSIIPDVCDTWVDLEPGESPFDAIERLLSIEQAND